MDTPERSPKVTIRNFLYDHENNAHLAFYSAIGRVIVLWGDLEHSIGLQAMLLFQSREAADFAQRPPFKISQKIKLWRRCFDTIPYLQIMRKAAHLFANEFKEVADDRDPLRPTSG